LRVTTPYTKSQAYSNYTQYETDGVNVRGEGKATPFNSAPLNAQYGASLTTSFDSGPNSMNSYAFHAVNQTGNNLLSDWYHNMTQGNMLVQNTMSLSVKQVFDAQALREQEQARFVSQSPMMYEPFHGNVVSMIRFQEQSREIFENLINRIYQSQEHTRRDMCMKLRCTGYVEDLFKLMPHLTMADTVPQRSFMEVIMGMLRHQMVATAEESDQIKMVQEAQTMPILYLIILGVLMIGYGATVHE
jgi:hypothetical protein